MICPLCGSEMEAGRLIGDRYALKWLPACRRLFLGIWAFGATAVDSRKGISGLRPFVNGQKCAHCRKLILDMD